MDFDVRRIDLIGVVHLGCSLFSASPSWLEDGFSTIWSPSKNQRVVCAAGTAETLTYGLALELCAVFRTAYGPAPGSFGSFRNN
eukprot:6172578-Pleurochrysis_carterae.AAC.4